MARYLLASISVAVAIAVSSAVGPVGAALAAPPCDPIQTPPHFRGQVPTPQQVLGYELGSREATAAEINTYIGALDAASSRVVSGQFATSWEGLPLKYSIVGKPGNLTPSTLATIRANAAALRNPLTPTAQAANLAAHSPAILWLAGNVHGNEESGADADLRILYELADRDDCAAQQITDNAVVVIVPTQNPDGRENETRRNHYDFDLNRDWFARTQPETDGKLELMRQYPPVLMIDAHEMGGQHYFFRRTRTRSITRSPTRSSTGRTSSTARRLGPVHPSAHPVLQRRSVRLLRSGLRRRRAGPRLRSQWDDVREVQRRSDHRSGPTNTTFRSGSRSRPRLFTGSRSCQLWHQEYVEAYFEGVNGQLEPNFVNDKGSRLLFQVPTDLVRHYFLRDDPAKQPELRALVRRLQRMDVAVYRLTSPLTVPDYKPYGRTPRLTVLPACTYWIPMAQQQHGSRRC